MKIGSLLLNDITVLAPLAGVTNLPFRLMIKEQGCGLVCSEMLSANGLVYHTGKTEQMLGSVPEEKPLSVQIFGANPEMMAEAAIRVEASGADILDINFGCSVRKVLKTGSGAALMKVPERTEALLKAVRKSIDIPLTIKIRSGWDKSGEQAVGIARIAEACGVDAIAVHPRTAPQGFGGEADWRVITAVKEQVSIPVIGNGDITKPEHAIQMLEETGCDAVMIGRASLVNPWIFSQVSSLIKREPVQSVTVSMQFDAMISYLKASVRYSGEKQACYMMRSRLGWLSKGLPHSSKFRESIKQISSEAEAIRLIMAYKTTLEERIRERTGDVETLGETI